MARDQTDKGTRELDLQPRRPKKGPLRVGYLRVSTGDQSLDLQRDAMRRARVHVTYEETASGKDVARPELANALKALRAGDTLVIWRLDRLGRSLVHLVQTIEDLNSRGIAVESLTEKIDTGGATGKLFVGFIALMAEFERNLISERTRAGLLAARARGRKGGRKHSLTPAQVRAVRAMHKDKSVPIAEILDQFGIVKSTLYRYLKT